MILRQGEDERDHQTPKIGDVTVWAMDGTERASSRHGHGRRMNTASFPGPSSLFPVLRQPPMPMQNAHPPTPSWKSHCRSAASHWQQPVHTLVQPVHIPLATARGMLHHTASTAGTWCNRNQQPQQNQHTERATVWGRMPPHLPLHENEDGACDECP